MSDFDYIKQEAALSRIPLDPPDEVEHEEDCRAWKHRGQCTCPTVADLEAMDADWKNKARMEDL